MKPKQIILTILVIIFTISAFYLYQQNKESAIFYVSVFAAIAAFIPIILDLTNSREITLNSRKGGIEEVGIATDGGASVKLDSELDIKNVDIAEDGNEIKKK